MNELRSLPRNQEIEKLLLSMLMTEFNSTFPILQETGLSHKDFSHEGNALLFLKVNEFMKTREEFCPVLFNSEIPEFDAKWGIRYFYEVFTALSIFSESKAKEYAFKLKNLKALRNLIELTDKVKEEAYSENSDAQLITNELTAKADLITNQIYDDEGIQHVKQILGEIGANLEERLKNPEKANFLETPWSALNRPLKGGIEKGTLNIIGARPSVGKTAIALNLQKHFSAKLGQPTAFLSLETDEQGLVERHIAHHNGTNLDEFIKSKPTKGDLGKFKSAVTALQETPMFFKRYPYGKASDLVRTIASANRIHGIDIFLIDYIQRIKPSSREEASSPKLLVDNALSQLDSIRQKLGITLIVLAQLNREAEGDGRKKNLYTDLKMKMIGESSQIERDADTIMLLGHDESPEGLKETEEIAYRGVNIVKNRNGMLARPKLQFHKPTATFQTISTTVQFTQ